MLHKSSKHIETASFVGTWASTFAQLRLVAYTWLCQWLDFLMLAELAKNFSHRHRQNGDKDHWPCFVGSFWISLARLWCCLFERAHERWKVKFWIDSFKIVYIILIHFPLKNMQIKTIHSKLPYIGCVLLLIFIWGYWSTPTNISCTMWHVQPQVVLSRGKALKWKLYVFPGGAYNEPCRTEASFSISTY